MLHQHLNNYPSQYMLAGLPANNLGKENKIPHPNEKKTLAKL
jgi:hypothetical protein